jgi:hypothetical protein
LASIWWLPGLIISQPIPSIFKNGKAGSNQVFQGKKREGWSYLKISRVNYSLNIQEGRF